MLNKAILMGRLTRDPELRHTSNNTPVASFTLAVDRGFGKNAQNPQQQAADFIDIVCWEKRAEFVSNWFKKGQLVAVSGRIQQRAWKDKDGNNRYSFEIVADDVYFAESKRDSAQTGGTPFQAPARDQGYGAPAAPAEESGFTILEDDDEDLPF